MARLTLTTFVTLDGVMQAPGSPEEDRAGGFPHGGWLAPFLDADTDRFVDEVFERPQAFLLGRRTYEIYASYWPGVTDPADGVAAKLNGLPKYVATHTLTDPRWANTTLLGGDVPAEVARLKERLDGDGELQIHGSGALARTLMGHGLIDEYHLVVAPVALGAGIRLFPEGGPPTAFALTAARITASGAALLSYRPAEPAAFGDFSRS